jgi:hypothetical protein
MYFCVTTSAKTYLFTFANYAKFKVKKVKVWQFFLSLCGSIQIEVKTF